MIRTLGDESLVVYHRFENSESLEDFAKRCNIELPKGQELRFGKADKDFSAEAILVK